MINFSHYFLLHVFSLIISIFLHPLTLPLPPYLLFLFLFLLISSSFSSSSSSSFASSRILPFSLFPLSSHGHNSQDDPSITQPLIYHQIKNHPATLEIYQVRTHVCMYLHLSNFVPFLTMDLTALSI